jgi:2'-5' RNA ligase
MFPLILTLKLDSASFQYFDELRQKYFPPERNLLAAHLTMFHNLPGDELMRITDDARRICAEFTEFTLVFPEWRSLGKGVAAKVAAPELLNLRAQFAATWNEHLKPQDRQKFQPHITVQNKVAPDEARALLDKLSGEPLPPNGTAEGVALWHYLGAEWKLENEFLFSKSV